jgi:hypothetical protein
MVVRWAFCAGAQSAPLANSVTTLDSTFEVVFGKLTTLRLDLIRQPLHINYGIYATTSQRTCDLLPIQGMPPCVLAKYAHPLEKVKRADFPSEERQSSVKKIPLPRLSGIAPEH